MPNGYDRKKQLFAVVACDLAVVYVSLALAIWASARTGLITGFDDSVNIHEFLFMGPYFIFVFKSVGLYKEKTGILHINETISIFRGILFGFLFVFLLFFLFPVVAGLHKSLFFFFVFMMCLMPPERLLLRKWTQSRHERGIGVTNTLIIGTGLVAQRLASKLRLTPKIGFKPVGMIEDISTLPDHVEKKKVGAVFMAEQDLPYGKVLSVMNFCAGKKILFRFVPYIYNMPMDLISMDDIEGIPVIGVRGYSPHSLYAAFKRLVDFAVAFMALVFFLPLGIAIAIAIKLDSPGKVIFSQKRAGQFGKPFRIMKFRTMFAEAARYGVSPKDSTDSRITNVGRLLRKTGLDELPQFLNVLRGDMSLVGPRQEMVFIVREYSEIQKERLKVKPGITGLWQISEHRRSPIHENMEYDLFYIENQSLLLDLAILLRTFFSVFGLKGK
ncbi:MAG: exopolysaccharide biosynthesis polyprenyl glycosylphosphotransferase [Candidatus Omnitrophica bacterium]|nr:exopolysaccharide biosynthesis polyprenyl glycosylphosphotransferase [Candidatus Omnitrophota bacterium]